MVATRETVAVVAAVGAVVRVAPGAAEVVARVLRAASGLVVSGSKILTTVDGHGKPQSLHVKFAKGEQWRVLRYTLRREHIRIQQAMAKAFKAVVAQGGRNVVAMRRAALYQDLCHPSVVATLVPAPLRERNCAEEAHVP
eukprot:6655237-Prymnesium_polylepis.2